MAFKLGDKVRFLHEKGEGVIVAILSAHKVKVELIEGLEIDMQMNELAAVSDKSLVEGPVQHKDVKKRTLKYSKPHATDEMEVDLHTDALSENAYRMSNAQKLSMQLDHFQEALERAMKSHIKKIVFIHGVGNGVLRQSIRDILKRYDGVEFSDGAYKKYGAGATEVRITSRNKLKGSF
jgi:dsDNA-specific endonuclease/ATPase MutS2